MKALTVGELVAKLQLFPVDAPVYWMTTTIDVVEVERGVEGADYSKATVCAILKRDYAD